MTEELIVLCQKMFEKDGVHDKIKKKPEMVPNNRIVAMNPVRVPEQVYAQAR